MLNSDMYNQSSNSMQSMQGHHAHKHAEVLSIVIVFNCVFLKL